MNPATQVIVIVICFGAGQALLGETQPPLLRAGAAVVAAGIALSTLTQIRAARA